MFDTWNERDQVEFVQTLLTRMCHHQHGQINGFLKPILKRDFISALPGERFMIVAVDRSKENAWLFKCI